MRFSALHIEYPLITVQVHSTFRELEESNVLRPYMSDAIKEISKACQAFEAKECAPPSAGIKFSVA